MMMSSAEDASSCDQGEPTSHASSVLDWSNLHTEVNRLPKAGILILEELRDAKEEGRRFVRGELLARVEQKEDLGEQGPASSRLDRRAVE